MPSHHPSSHAGQVLVSMAPANAAQDHAADLSQVQPQPGTVRVANRQGVFLPAGPASLWSQLHPHTASNSQPLLPPHPHPQITSYRSMVNNPQHATSTLISAQMASTLHPLLHHDSSSPFDPQLLQQSQIAGPYAPEDYQQRSDSQTAAAAPAAAAAAPAAANFPSFLPQLPSRGQLTAHPATAPAWAADHLQVLPPAQPETQLDRGVTSGIPSGSHPAPNLPVQTAQQGMHPSPKDAAQQPLQLGSNPQAVPPQSPAGLPPSGVQRPPLLPLPAPCHMQGHEAKPSANPHATAASQLAVQTEDVRKGVTTLHMTGATPVIAPQATAAAQAPTAAAQAPTAAAQTPTAATQPPTAAAQPLTVVAEISTAGVPDATAAVCTTAHHATDAAQAQPALQLPPQQDDSADTAPAIAPAPAAAASAALAPTSIPPAQAKLPAPTTHKPSKSKKGAAHAVTKPRSSSRTGGAPTAGRTQLAAQASDSAAASGSLQAYLAHASPGSLTRLKQDLRRPPSSAEQAAASTPQATPCSSPTLLADPESTSIPEQPVHESVLQASDTPMAAADEDDVQPAALDASQLRAVSAHTGAAATQDAAGEAMDAAVGATQEAAAEAKNTAALQKRPEADSVAQQTQDRMIADTLRQWEATRRDLFVYASRVPDPVMKQKLTDVLAGKPVSPMLTYQSDSDSSSDSDAEPDQDTAGAVLPVLADVHRSGEALPARQSSNMPPNPSPLHPASDAQPHRQAQQRTLVTRSPSSSGLHPAQPSPKRPVAMRSVGQLHPTLTSSQHQPTRRDQPSPSHMLKQTVSPGRKVTTTRRLGDLPNAPVLPTPPALPDQATAVTQSSDQPASRKRGAGSSDVHFTSLAPGTL